MRIEHRSLVVEDTVEQIEFNKTAQFNGCVTDQVIFWGYYGRELHVVDVRVRSKVQALYAGAKDRKKFIEFEDLSDLRHPLNRRVYATYIIETVTSEDPEIFDMQFVPIHERRRLYGDSRHKDFGRFKRKAA